jgi:hypothetical protein
MPFTCEEEDEVIRGSNLFSLWATACPARRMTTSSLTPETQVTFSHSRIWATVITGMAWPKAIRGTKG